MKEYKYGKLVRMGNRNSKFSTDKRIEFIKCMRNAGVEIEILIEYMTLFERRIYISILETEQTIIMPKDIPHSVFGEEKFKMLLIVSFYKITTLC